MLESQREEQLCTLMMISSPLAQSQSNERRDLVLDDLKQTGFVMWPSAV